MKSLIALIVKLSIILIHFVLFLQPQLNTSKQQKKKAQLLCTDFFQRMEFFFRGCIQIFENFDWQHCSVRKSLKE